LLTWAFKEKASRIAFQTGHPVWVSIHGRNYRVTRGAVDEYELSQIVNHLYGADGMARLQGGNDFDTAYAIAIDRSTRLHFRLKRHPHAHLGARRRKHCAAADFGFAAVTRGATRRARHP
jgi:defect-in-organelle-trafficking protein DotB